MIGKRLYGVLAAVAFVGAVLRCAAPPSTTRYALPIAHLEQTQDDLLPASVVVRGFDVSLPTGMDVLDQRAEVVFDN